MLANAINCRQQICLFSLCNIITQNFHSIIREISSFSEVKRLLYCRKLFAWSDDKIKSIVSVCTTEIMLFLPTDYWVGLGANTNI
jgi:hypothetical protein